MKEILLRMRRAAFWAVLPWIPLLGCATPAPLSTVKHVEFLPSYKKVYLFEGESDPRGVQPKVLSRLQSLGFEVVLVKKGQSILSQGSGFIISRDGHILTCAHLFKDKKEATVWVGGKRYEADVINKDARYDLAIVKVRSPSDVVHKPLALSRTDKFSMGQDVFTMGFPLSSILGNTPRLNKGLINATVGIRDDPDQLQVSVQIQPGNSGSPLFNDQREVIGIIFSTLSSVDVLRQTRGVLPQNVNFALKAGPIRKFLEQSGIQQNPSAEIVPPSSFDEAKESIVRIYSGIEPQDKPPELICSIFYQYIEYWNRFRAFRLQFYDRETGKLLLEVGQYKDTELSTEDEVLNRALKEVGKQFFPPVKSN